MITSEMAQSHNIKSRQTRQGVQDSLQAISTQIKGVRKLPSNGVVLLAGETTEGFVNETIVPLRAIDRFFYRCGSKFYI